MSPCTFLEWDSDFFSCRIGRVVGAKLKTSDMPLIEQWVVAERIDCLYLLSAIEDVATPPLARKQGFDMVDLRLTYERKVDAQAYRTSLRPAKSDDRPALQQIARGTFVNTRFYRDPHFAPRADALYEVWVDRALNGFADCVLVAGDDAGAPAGFVCCHRREGTAGEIGLTAVRADQRGRGVGAELVQGALAWFAGNGLSSAFVVTNGANIPAQRLYQRQGFGSSCVQVWYHRWSRTLRLIQ